MVTMTSQQPPDGYWEGANWVYEVDITNGSGAGGTISVDITVAVGNDAELLYAVIENDDGSTRTGRAEIEDDGGNLLDVSFAATIGAGLTSPGIPTVANRRILSGGQVFHMELAAVGSVQDAKFGAVFRIRGGVPAAVETGNDTPVIVINTEKVM